MVTVAKQVEVRANLKKYFDLAYDGTVVIVPRKENKNVVLLSEREYQELERARRNVEYLRKLEVSDQQIELGEIVSKTFDELEEMNR